MEAKVIGIGGIFIKFNNPDLMKIWYQDVLGLITNDYGVLFSFNGEKESKGYLQLGTFPSNSDYFGTETQKYMLNFRVNNLELFKIQLTDAGVKILDEIENFDYGKFLHIEDPEGNKIELWEPVDGSFSKEPQTIMQ